MLRKIIFYICFFPVTIFFSLVAICFKNQKAAHWCERNWGRSIVLLSGCKIEADLSELDPEQTYIFMVNHQSFFDIPLLFCYLQKWQFKFIAKQSLFKIPVFGNAMSSANHISIDRNNKRQAMKDIQRAVATADNGNSPLIFPEGTRNPNPSKLLPFQIGGMIIALKCRKPIAPVIMVGPAETLPKGKLIIKPGTKIKIKALPPIDPSGYTIKDREKLKDDLQKMMDEAHAEMSNE
ncbi:lysophospholipid acyltransferase family protein [Maridesulfovibrio bastinii]|uniref:lysophospholipid acyltransferase family protein n=1 Tax=Maridesulfovibrio bastinii TaxID=47157 RepID=UPI000416C6FE|nr:lysophospholipid acyltransferase family protein [Maridesulfovibrio bastinii]